MRKRVTISWYLMSNPNPAATLDPQTLPSASTQGSTDLVSTGQPGSNLTNREISAPLIPIKGGRGPLPATAVPSPGPSLTRE